MVLIILLSAKNSKLIVPTMKLFFQVCFVCVVFIATFAGIIRDDVPLEKSFALAAQPQFQCVGKIYSDTTFRGSCVLIGNKFVLTAAHIFVEDSGTRPEIVTLRDSTKVTLFNPIDQRLGNADKYKVRFGENFYQCKSLSVYPVYSDSLAKGHCDLAIVELSEQVPHVIPATMTFEANELHSLVVGVGFGYVGHAGTPSSVHLCDTMSAGENTIDSIGGYVLNGVPTVLYTDFDSPDKKECNQMGSAIPTAMEYSGTGGDSGGGLFRQSNGKWQLIGILCDAEFDLEQVTKMGYYGSVSSYTRVSAFSNWIKGIVNGK